MARCDRELQRYRARRLFRALTLLIVVGCSVGCTVSRKSLTGNSEPATNISEAASSHELPPQEEAAITAEIDEAPDSVQHVGYWKATKASDTEGLAELEAIAAAANPVVRRLEAEVQAAWSRSGHIDRLPDPTIGTNVFGNPIETAAGSQRVNLTVAQMIPWLERLDAKAQQACYEAMTLQEALRAERLKVVAEVRSAWYRLYVLGRQTETNRANQELLTSLIEVATARVATGTAAQGDVLLGTLQLSRLEEELIAYRQQIESTKAALNRAAGREASHPVSVPRNIAASLPEWSFESLRELASEHQPAIEAARLKTHATHWGLEIARLERRPNLAVSATWFAIDNNRPATTVVDVGEDAWSLGAQVSIPLWQDKYDAIENEAIWKHQASQTSVEDATRQIEARILDLWEQAVAADRTRSLYRDTILPQARQTFEADQQSYANGAVEFDRVMQDFRNVLTLDDGLHRATGQLATALAQIEEAVGTRIETAQSVPIPVTQ